MNLKTGMAVAAAMCAMAGVAQGQLTFAFDINSLKYHFKDGSGATKFDGTNHTGTVEWEFSTSDPTTSIAATRKGTGGVLGTLDDVNLGSYLLQDFYGTLNLTAGSIDSGSFTVELDNGDWYTASFAGGKIGVALLGGFELVGYTEEGAFSDDTFGDIDVSAWYDRQFNPGELFGTLLKFRFDGNPQADADMEIFVVVPLPPAAYAGLGMLAGVMGLSYARRRR